jgi:hypothetical protein
MTAVNEKMPADLAHKNRMILHRGVRAKTISPIATTLRHPRTDHTEVVLRYPVPTC